MQILEATVENVQAASGIVNVGGLVVYPTDTVYGLGCNPFNINSVGRLLKAKGERNKPLPILASDIDSLEKVAHLSDRIRRIMERFWPGPLTIVVLKKPLLPRIITSNMDSVGVRIPNHKKAIELIRLSNGLLVGTSANKTGKKSPSTAQEAAKHLGFEVDIILDDGPTPLGISSTILDLTTKEPRIIRKGPISLEDILSV